MGSPAPEGSPVERPAKRAKVDDFAAASTNGTETASVGPDGDAKVIHGDEAPTALEGVTDKPATQSSDAVMADASQADEAQSSSGAKSESKQNGGAERVAAPKEDARDIRSGLAPVKAEYLIPRSELQNQDEAAVDDDAAEARGQHDEQQDRRDARDSRDRKDKKARGQNKERTFGKSEDTLKLCNSRAYYSEFSPRECKFGERCKLCHDLRKYLQEGRREDVEAFEGKCPVFEVYGRCLSGWKCRFVKGHMKEVEHEDGRKELVLLGARDQQPGAEEGGTGAAADPEDERPSVVNVVDQSVKIDLNRRRVDMAEADKYITWLNDETKLNKEVHHRRKNQSTDDNKDLQSQYVEPPFLPSEKRKLYFGRETPALAPLTTQGNLPFRRLCVELGAQLTYSEMALGLPLIQGNKSDWALMRAHGSEITPPAFNPAAESPSIVQDYENSRDLKFGVQISANQPWVAVKATEALKRFCPHLRLIDLNCGCPIDSVYKSGAGSALLEAHGKLERVIRGMNAVSGEIPITAKIRMGVKTNKPNATSTIGKLAFGSRETRDRLGAPGCAAITLHGRSREQRYTRRADWSYIAECSALIKSYNERKDDLTDTAGEPDERTLPNSKDGRMYFLGNGDCYSHEEYFEHIDKAGVDTVMIGRGALVKPWLFEEIEKGQYLDKSASERLGYIEKFVKYGLEAWGSDELGIGFTRRFLLEWMSFTHRYVPIGLLERLPPSLNDRPPAYRGRNDLETLLASNNYKDWLKISEMFLGPCHPGFTFQPKHKSNAYEAEG